MSALAVVLLELLCCLGLGAAMLRLLGIDDDLDRAKHWALAFATGFGILGWLVFPLGISGYLSSRALTILLSAGAVAALLLPRPRAGLSKSSVDGTRALLLALLAMIAVFDLAEAIAPPADADTLAYHFAVPKQFVEAGRIHFILQPLNGAIPFLVHMTYIPALALGGELAATLWTAASGWAAAGLLYVLCRGHLGVNGSLAVTLVFLTTPAIVYGGGAGQVETRIALFVMLAAWGAARALDTGRAGYAVLAGLGAGFFAAAKYTGLLFAAVSGLVLVVQRRWLAHGLTFAVATVFAGFQWYVWNAMHTGDPVFPMLFQYLGRDDLALWPKAHDLVFKESYFRVENPLPRSPLWLLLYPFKATLDFTTLPDAGRVGMGPFGLLVLPFAVLGAWRYRDRVRSSPLYVYAALVLLFYGLWFFVGGSQRPRHLVPVLPLFLICISVAADRWTAGGRFRKPLAAAFAITLFIQAAGHGLFALNYFQFLTRDSGREAFLLRNVNGYAAVPWVNQNLAETDRLYIVHRQLVYHLRVPHFSGSHLQGAVELRPAETDAKTLYAQLRSVGITHFLLPRSIEAGEATYPRPLNLLDRAGCLVPLKRIEARTMRSRTLSTLVSQTQTLDVLRLADERCLD